MSEERRYTPLWVIAVAAALVALFLHNEVGVWGSAGLVAATVVGVWAYRRYREKNPPKEKVIGVRCLRCGATLAATARSCRACGSASWTFTE